MNHNVDSMGASQCTIFSLCQNGRRESEIQRKNRGEKERGRRRERERERDRERELARL